MSYFDSSRKTKKVVLPGQKKFYVVIYDDVKWGESKQFLHVDAEGNIDLIASAADILPHVIVEWNLTKKDATGADVVQEITPENIDLLRSPDALYLINQMGADVEQAAAAKKN